ncbi:anti-phage ZorAB system protein ZorA [Demequina iriomotensis]|uniref:anti-phage ZorAB system protein ZorA n=1 Tax=Demequina iriomotensis TaxID=1536641 RepID=UPI000AC13272|nr:anti-phage ZorAB system protein ZorA [Demequina iriomotensis]
MFEWLWLLIPDSSWFSEGGTQSLTATFITLMIAISLLTVLWLWRQRRTFARRITGLRAVVAKAGASDPMETRRGLVAEAIKHDKVVASLWREFDETLVASPDGIKLYNTVDADYFFNERTIAPGLVHNRLLTAVPAILTAVGVLGTFLGLTMGLGGLNVHTTLGEGADTQELLEGIQAMIGAAGVAFVTSVWGVLLSIVVNLIEKAAERRVLDEISSLQQSIDHVYPRVTPEQPLLAIQHSSDESRQSLQELHERIGDRLQQTVEQVSHNLETALSSAISTAMGPAMEKLVSTTTEQSTEVFGQLVDKFAASFTDIGRKQAEALDDSSTRLTASIDSIAETFAAITEESRRQSLEMRNQQASVLMELTNLTEALRSSSRDLGDAATEFGEASPKIVAAGTAIEGSLTLAATTLSKIQENFDLQARLVGRMQEQSAALGGELAAAATTVTSGTDAMAQRLAEIGDAQHVFQSELRTDAETVAQALRAHVSDLEAQVSKWLSDYSADIESQIERRMTVWNSHSQDYANQMLEVSKVLATVISEIELKSQTARVVGEADELVREAEASAEDRRA